jgi:hypothetical protein
MKECLEEINANNYSPVENYGENGHAVRLSVKEELESEKTFGINQVSLYFKAFFINASKLMCLV